MSNNTSSINKSISKKSSLGVWGASLFLGGGKTLWGVTILFCLSVFLFFALAYPHHLHYQEQFQLFLFESTYVWDIVKVPGGIADLLGRFCTQFFLFAWIGALIIAILLSAIQLVTLKLSSWGRLYGLSFVPSFLLWIFLLDENALLGGVWAVLLTLLAVWGFVRLSNRKVMRWVYLIITIPLLYWMVGCPLPTDKMWFGVHYHRYPTVFPWLPWAAVISSILLALLARWFNSKVSGTGHRAMPLITFALVATVMGSIVWKNTNFKAEKTMQYDFMASHQQWNRILETISTEKPNNQIGVTVQNLALAMKGQLLNSMSDYNQNGMLGLLPEVQRDATSPLPTAEAFYQLGMVNVAQRTVFEAQEAILDYQKSARCYKRLAQTNLINGEYEVARKYLMALQKTLFYRQWASETLPLLYNEKAIAAHPEYGRMRKCSYNLDFFFGDQVTPDMLRSLYLNNKDNNIAYQYMLASFALTGDRESFQSFVSAGK